MLFTLCTTPCGTRGDPDDWITFAVIGLIGINGGGPELMRLMRVIWLSMERGSGLPGAGLLVADDDDGAGDMNTLEAAQRGDSGNEQVDDAGDQAAWW